MHLLGRTAAFAAVAGRVLPPIDRAFAGRRRVPSALGTGLPVCFLRTRGRRTGEERTVPLLVVEDGGTAVVAESNWGRRQRPAWAVNLDADPRAVLTVSGASRPVVARRASAAEEERWWPLLLAVWPGWQGYRERAGREIALYALEPPEPPA